MTIFFIRHRTGVAKLFHEALAGGFWRFVRVRSTLAKSAVKASAMTTAQKICAVPIMFPSRAIIQPAITAGSPIEM